MTPDINDQTRPGTFSRGLFLLAATRPHLLLPAWLAALTGAAFTLSGMVDVHLPLDLTAWSCALLAANLMNVVPDRETDRVNDKNQVWAGHLNAAALLGFAGILALTGLTISLLLIPQLLIPTLATVVLGYAYSWPPLRLCGRPGWDLVAHLCAYAIIAPWVGNILVSGSNPVLKGLTEVLQTSSLWLALPVGVAFLFTAVLDLPGDRLTGKITSAVALAGLWPSLEESSQRRGFRVAIIILVMMGVLAAGWPGLQQWPQTLLPILTWLVFSYALQGFARRLGE